MIKCKDQKLKSKMTIQNVKAQTAISFLILRRHFTFCILIFTLSLS